ncbi:RNA-binding protein [Bacillus massiliigorillae]|uniref:YlmH family RNA-binding protein n=1 Tax=Bacillus massiliigorillae TaxID=1243664 RepID=UPI0003A740DF|nr:RNA-binding protein [Bacillus massiliigorillae]
MSIYQHFRSEEKNFIDAVLDWKESVETFYTPKLTLFLDPREQQILSSIIGQNDDCQLLLFGGHSLAERKRALLYPNYHNPIEDDFHMSLIEISYNRKFHELKHPQILGTLMSLGIKREKFGDVLLNSEGAQIIVSKDIADYVIANITKIGQAGVTLALKDFQHVLEVEDDWQESVMTSSSLRLDSLFSSMANISRQKAQDFIAGGKVKVNHKVIEAKDFECQEGDQISVRGFGRYRIMSIDGKTKKEKWRIMFGKRK